MIARLLFIIGAAHAAQLKPALKLRGGVGIEAGTAALVGSGLVGANGLYCGLAPEPACAAYGVDKPDFNLEQMVKSVGYTFIAFAILAISTLKGLPLSKAFAWGNLPWILLTLDNIWNGVSTKMGMPVAGQYLLLAINCAGSYCGFTDTSVDTAAKALAGWSALNGAFFALAPAEGAKAWGMAADAKFNAMFKNFGYALVSYAVLLGALATGSETTVAIGYSFVASLVGLVDQLAISKTFEVITDDKNPAYAWAVIMIAVVAGTLA